MNEFIILILDDSSIWSWIYKIFLFKILPIIRTSNNAEAVDAKIKEMINNFIF